MLTLDHMPCSGRTKGRDVRKPGRLRGVVAGLCMIACLGNSAAAESGKDARGHADGWQWCKTLAAYDYVGIAKAYADFMIAHGRDTYGPKHTPLFVTGMDRHTGKRNGWTAQHRKR